MILVLKLYIHFFPHNSQDLIKNRWRYFEMIWTKHNNYLNANWVKNPTNIKSTCQENIRHTATPDAEVGSSLNHPSLTESHLFTRHFWKLLQGKAVCVCFFGGILEMQSILKNNDHHSPVTANTERINISITKFSLSSSSATTHSSC